MQQLMHPHVQFSALSYFLGFLKTNMFNSIHGGHIFLYLRMTCLKKIQH